MATVVKVVVVAPKVFQHFCNKRNQPENAVGWVLQGAWDIETVCPSYQLAGVEINGVCGFNTDSIQAFQRAEPKRFCVRTRGFGIGMPLASRDGIFFSLARLHVPQAGAKCIHAMLKCSPLINCFNESTSDCFVKSKIAMWAPLHLSQVLSTDKLRKPASRAVMDKRAVPANTSIIRISLIGLPEKRLNECCETEFGVNEPWLDLS